MLRKRAYRFMEELEANRNEIYQKAVDSYQGDLLEFEALFGREFSQKEQEIIKKVFFKVYDKLETVEAKAEILRKMCARLYKYRDIVFLLIPGLIAYAITWISKH